MFKLADFIYDRFFTSYEDQNDNYKVNGKGFLQRYVETLAEELDEHTIKYVSSILENVLIPETARDNFIPYIEEGFGLPVFINDIGIRRNLIKNFFDLVAIKGTTRSYELLLQLLGFTNIRLDYLNYSQGFDSRFTFDDPLRVFDNGSCVMCQDYDLYLDYSGILTTEVYEAIYKAVKFVEPINAHLKNIYVNGSVDVARFYINVGTGDLMYVPSILNEDTFVINNGDLHTSGTGYSINNGDLLKE